MMMSEARKTMDEKTIRNCSATRNTSHVAQYSIFCRILSLTSFILLLSSFAWILPVHAADKTWTGSVDATDWSGDENWYPSPAPAPVDNVTINSKDANVRISETFTTKSLTLGGNEETYLTTEDFISGKIEPISKSDVAILNRKDGHLVLKGAGTLVVKGTYKDSEENLAAQPSLVFTVQ